jgi:hypothetical protein
LRLTLLPGLVSQRASGWWAQKVRTATVIGTPMKVPDRPHRKVHRKIENRTTNGDMDSAVPDRRGST